MQLITTQSDYFSSSTMISLWWFFNDDFFSFILQALHDPVGNEGSAQQVRKKPTSAPQGMFRTAEATAAYAGREEVFEFVHSPCGDPAYTSTYEHHRQWKFASAKKCPIKIAAMTIHDLSNFDKLGELD